MNAFVEADGRVEIFLQRNVAEEIVPAEGLLDHHEVVAFELFEERQSFERISGIGVDHQLDAGKILAQALDGVRDLCQA